MVTNIDRATLLTLIKEGAQLIDVLPEAEYEAGHIPGAVNIPLRTLNQDAIGALSPGKPTVVY